jgi:hypothetical protein
VKVTKAGLGHLAFLAEGGFGRVYRAGAFTLPGDATQLAYKEFTADHAKQARSAKTAVTFRAGLSPADRAELDRFTAWPRELVRDGSGAVCGFLMPLIPPEFFCRMADADSGKLTSKPREMSWLIASQQQRTAAQIDLPEVDHTARLILLAQLVYIVGRLHKHGWVFGDLSFGNVVFSIDPPRVMLIDCDGAAPLSDRGREQFSTPFWDPPECPAEPPRQQELQDAITDAYKLGLAILRCLTPGQGASSTRALSRFAGELDAPGITLVARALSADRADRPTAKDVYLYLSSVVAPRVAPPKIAYAELVTPFRLRGQDARVEWQLGNATDLTIFEGNSQHAVTLAQHPHGYTFRPADSGPVSLEVRNRFGAVSVELGEITLYELPPFQVDLNYLPRPQVPHADPFIPAPLMATLEGRPLVAIGEADVPHVPSPGTPDLAGAMPPSSELAAMWPRVDDAAHGFANTISSLITSESGDFVSALQQILAEERRRRPGTGAVDTQEG